MNQDTYAWLWGGMFVILHALQLELSDQFFQYVRKYDTDAEGDQGFEKYFFKQNYFER